MRRFVLALAALLILAAPASANSFNVTTNSFTFGQAPDWMPNGQVVWHDDVTGKNQVYVSDLDGTGTRCLTCEQAGPNMVAQARPQGDWVLFHSWLGHQMTIGAPGFGGMGSSLFVVDPATKKIVQLTKNPEGEDDYHAYWSPDGKRLVWAHLNWDFVDDNGQGYWDIRVADFVDDATGPHLANTRIVRPGNGHYYETQHWAPDGKGFLYTESVGSTLNLELFWCHLPASGECKPERLTDNPYWDEQAIFTPDQKQVIWMSTRDHPGLWNTWAQGFATAGTPNTIDNILILPLFEAGFLQPLFPESNDLYELNLKTRAVRRLTTDGDDGWITPEFAWDSAGKRLLWTELKYRDGVRTPLPPDPQTQANGLQDLLANPPTPKSGDTHPAGQNSLLTRRTRIGTYTRR
ncbi:MAG: TolB protein [Thermoleophilaceae bacterium]|nr:TolB protein [Thermoleophilaceae bacterium]